jgi:hypothetical protein
MTTHHSKVSAAQLDQAYRATAYVVRLPESLLTLKIDEPSEILGQLLTDGGYPTWAFISAQNPGSCLLDETENSMRHQTLLAAVNQLGLIHFEGTGIPPTPDWPPERSLLILGIKQHEAHALAVQFGQNAVLFGAQDGIPRLQYVHSVPEAI